jgi:hypothetical protein
MERKVASVGEAGQDYITASAKSIHGTSAWECGRLARAITARATLAGALFGLPFSQRRELAPPTSTWPRPRGQDAQWH